MITQLELRRIGYEYQVETDIHTDHTFALQRLLDNASGKNWTRTMQLYAFTNVEDAVLFQLACD